MADDANHKGSTPSLVFDATTAKPTKPKPKAKGGTKAGYDDENGGHGGATPPGRHSVLRRTCVCLAVVGALAALVILVLSLTVLKVRDPTLSMESVKVRWFNVRLGAAKTFLRINATLAGTIAIRNPNYESMRFGASATEIFVDDDDDDDDGVLVGVGRAPPGTVAARGETSVTADIDVFVDRVVGSAAVGLLFGGGEVRLASHTTVDGRVSVLGGLYGRRTVRVAMRCRVALCVSLTGVVAGSPSCVADFAR